MNIRNYLTIVLATLAIIALLGLAGVMTYLNTDDENPVKQAIDSVLPMDKLFPEEETEVQTETIVSTEAASEETEAVSTVAAHSFIFVGDSRTVSMGDAVADTCTYLGEEGEGYQWFSSEGAVALRTLLENDPSQTVIYNLGVNDPENVDVYIELYENIAKEFSDTPFYYMSVNPLDEDADFTTTNAMAQEFNTALKNAFPDGYLDTYTYLTENGFTTTDGLHYDEATSVKLHDYVVNTIMEKAA